MPVFLLRNVIFVGMIGIWILWVPHTFRSQDFVQYYAAGTIALRGESRNLYDQDAFSRVQHDIARAAGRTLPIYSSLYPPSVALVFAPLAALPYSTALAVWCFIQVACFGASTLLLVSHVPGTRLTKASALLGVAAFLPIWVSLSFTQAAGLWLLVFSLGLTCDQRGWRLIAGFVLSWLALKPQLAIGVSVWLLLRRDSRALVGLTLGGAAQAILVAGSLGVDVWTRYLANLGTISEILRSQWFSPAFQHGIERIAANLLGPGARPIAWVLHLLISALAAYLASRVLAQGDVERGRCEHLSAQERRAYAAAVLLSLLLTPHLLTYDLSLLVIPLVYLWLGLERSPRAMDQMVGRLLYIVVSLSPLSVLTGFSYVPIGTGVALTLLAVCAAGHQAQRRAHQCPAASQGV